MKKDTGQLHGELMDSLYQFIKDIGIHLPPDMIFDTTTSLINVFIKLLLGGLHVIKLFEFLKVK